jgi:outer membrane receptor protein involved in Fe transport
MEFSLEYRMPENRFGMFRASASAEHSLGSRLEILPGVPFVQDRPGGFRRPKWSGDAQLAWSHGRGNASLRARHTGALAPASAADFGLAAYTVVDLNAGWRLRTAAKPERRAKEWRVMLGIGNLTAETPPWADTVNGYRGGSALGRTYSVAFSVEM